MIRKTDVIKWAVCDACGRTLSSEMQKNPDGTSRDVHYGSLKSFFGYGSVLDDENSYDLCEGCWRRCLDALRIPVYRNIGTMPLYCNLEEQAPLGVPTPVWRCHFCNFRSCGHGSMPDHPCAKWESLLPRCAEACTECDDGNPPIFGYEAIESGDSKEEIHKKTTTRRFLHYSGGKLIRCQAHDLLVKEVQHIEVSHD